MTSTESLKQLLALAAKATRGKLVFEPGWNHIRDDSGIIADEVDEELGQFFAACSPDVIAEIVNELLAAREEIKKLSDLLEECRKYHIDARDDEL